MEYYSAIKNNEIIPLSGKWMEVEIVMFSKISQTQNAKQCVCAHL
jgi:hypothetical protein